MAMMDLMKQFTGGASEEAEAAVDPLKAADSKLLEKWKVWKKECTDQRWIFERQWMRNIWYMLNRQWIYFDSKRGQWQDKRLAKWVPRPVTNIVKEAVQTVRASFSSINYGANARPLGEDNINMITASVADDYAPVLHEDHDMTKVMAIFDWWMFTCGNALLHSCVNYDYSNGTVKNPVQVCAACTNEDGTPYETTDADIANAGQKCPNCGSPGPFQPAMEEDGVTPKVNTVILPKGVTYALSPFEYMFPLIYEHFDKSPYVVLMRWRDKSWYEQHPEASVRALAKTLPFATVPTERSMQIFKTLPFQSDLGIAPPYFASGGANTDSEGVIEYDVWVKPCEEYPKGYVVRFVGESQPLVFHSENESLPGPIPYHTPEREDGGGNDPIFPFHHAMFDYIGGRPFGSSLIDPIIQKQDMLNQVDSMMLMIIMRMSNPIWLEPKGAEVEKFTGEPGLVVKWNPLISNGTAKPERIAGENIPQSLFAYRELIKQEAEELTGTYDLLKGTKPAGVEAYAAMNLLLERSQARFTTCFKERGQAYKGWLKDALTIEQQFGEETRVRAMMSKTKGWAFQTFKKADLQGQVDIIIEDGTLSPKTSLGERASIEHLRQLGLLDPQDPDQKMVVFQKFGQEGLIPGISSQVIEAWRVFDTFEKWAADPNNLVASLGLMAQQFQEQASQAQAQTPEDAANTMPPQPPQLQSPLQFKRWYNPLIHRSEFVKWCVSDRGRELLLSNPTQVEPFVNAYLDQIDAAMQMMMMQAAAQAGGAPGAPGGAPGGAGAAMANSNQNAGGVGKRSSGSGGTSENNMEANAQKNMGG